MFNKFIFTVNFCIYYDISFNKFEKTRILLEDELLFEHEIIRLK